MAPLRSYIPAFLIGAIGIVLSVLIGIGMGAQQRSLASANFRSVATERILLIEESIMVRQTLLRTVVGFFNASQHVTAAEFDAFITTAQPEAFRIQAIAWVPKVSAAAKVTLETPSETTGKDAFAITERSQDGWMIPAKDRPVYYPIHYLAPLRGNEMALGFDLGADETRLSTLMRANETGKITASERINLVQKAGDRAGVLFIAPLYDRNTPNETPNQRRAALLGFIVAAVKAKSLIDVTRNSLEKKPYHIELRDLTAEGEKANLAILHRHPGLSGDMFTHTVVPDGAKYSHTINIGGRRWQINVISADPILLSSDQFSWLGFFVAFFVTGAVAGQLGLTARRSQTIANTVIARTSELGALTNQANEHVARIQAIIDNTSEGMIVIDRDGLIETFNIAAENIFGYRKEEVLGHDVSVLLPENERSHHKGYVRHSNLHSYRIINQARDLWGRRKDGSLFAMELNVAPLDQRGERRFIGIFRDVTERRLAEEKVQHSEQRFRDFADSASDWIWETDSDLRLIFISERFFDLSGIEPKAILGKSRHEFAIEQSVGTGLTRDEWDAHHADMLAHRQFRDFRYGIKRPDGNDIYFSLNGKPVFDDNENFIGYRGTGTDITALTAASAELKKAKDEAESANRAKSEFLSSMSHELRTPLNAVLGFGQLLESDPSDPLTPSQKESITHILSSGEHLLGLINDVLDLAKIESGNIRMTLEPVDPVGIVHACLTMANTMGNPRDIQVLNRCDKSTLLPIYGDRIRLKQILLNFLSNAVKYNNDSGFVTLTTLLTDDGFLNFTITDTGPGIPENQQAHMFEAFNRLGHEDSKVEGTGIGLVITKELITQMKGRLGFESKPGHGSSFWFEIPLATSDQKKSLGAEEQIQEDATPSVVDSSVAQTVLYVEDNHANFMLMEKIFNRFPHLELLRTETAEAGIMLAEDIKPALILMDITLPGMSGQEALAVLRKSEKTRDIPIVAVSANAMPRDVKEGLAAGFDDYLTKPVNISRVITIVMSFTNAGDDVSQ